MVDDMDRITIETGMQDISAGTCIKFVPRTHEANFLDIQPRYGWVRRPHKTYTSTACVYIYIYSTCHVVVLYCINTCTSLSCWSFLGQTGGGQTLSLQSPGCMWSGVASHELMHALGFVHEQSRSDRDHYVTIVWNNVIPGSADWLPASIVLYRIRHLHSLFTFCDSTEYIHNFKKQVTNNLNSPYDYSSVMHYGRWATMIQYVFTLASTLLPYAVFYVCLTQVCLLCWRWTNNNP